MTESLDIRSASLLDFLPDSISADPEILALSKAIDPELQAVSAAILEAIVLPRAAVQSEVVLDALAWGFGLLEHEGWGTATIERKRALMAQVVALYKRRGTVWAVRRALDLLGEAYTLTEWHQTGGNPFTYRLQIIVSESGLTTAQLESARALVEAYGPIVAYPEEISALVSVESATVSVQAASVGLVVAVAEEGL